MINEHIKDVDSVFRRIIEDNDEKAFQQLFYDYFAPLCVFAHRYVEDWDVCEDLVQDSFLRIWENRKKIQINNSVRNYLLTLVRNRCIDYLRKEELKNKWISWQWGKREEAVEQDIYSETELNHLIKASLCKLSEEIRTAFELSRFESKKYAEIADIQHVTLRTVEERIGKALKFLKNELKDFLPALFLFIING